MITFYFFAFPLERILGTFAFVALYLSSMALSHVCTWHKYRNDSNYASLGASGAISGVLFAYIVYDPFTKLYIFPLPLPIPALLFAVAYVAYTYYSAQRAVGRIRTRQH